MVTSGFTFIFVPLFIVWCIDISGCGSIVIKVFCNSSYVPSLANTNRTSQPFRCSSKPFKILLIG